MNIKKIAVVGPESTGKSTLSQQLAVHFNTVWVPEYARQYLNEIDRPYNFEDLDIIAQGQLNLENDWAVKANKLLFCDTELMVIKIWSEFKYHKLSQYLETQYKNTIYDGYLLLYPDLPWEYDPQREAPDVATRVQLFDIYRKNCEALKQPYQIISGNYNDRLKQAIEFSNQFTTIP